MAAERPTRRMLGETLRPGPTLAKAADALNVYSHALAAAHAPVLKRAHHIAGAIERDDALMRLATVASSDRGMIAGADRRTWGPAYKDLAAPAPVASSPRGMIAGADRRTWGPAYNKDLAPRETPDRVAERTARMMTRAAKKDTLSKVVDNSNVGKPKAM